MISHKLGRIAACCVGLAALSTAVACTSSASGTGEAPTVPPAPVASAAPDSGNLAGVAVIYTCDHQPAARPATFILSCGNSTGTSSLSGLTWSGWGSANATATGQYRGIPCSPYCAKGRGHSYSVNVKVSVSLLARGTYTEMTIYTPKHTLPLLTFILASTGPKPQE